MYPHKGAFSPMGGPPNLAATNLPMVGETQWMSQSAYQNIDLDKVDWAALAQQWIHMRESCAVEITDPMPSAPPPPRISNPIPEYEEKGEAPMEVEHDDEPSTVAHENTLSITAPPPPTNIFNQTNNWNSEPNSRGQHQKQWNRKGNRWNSKTQRMPNDGCASGQVFNNAKPIAVWSGTSSTSCPSSSSVVPNTPSFGNANNSNDLRMHGMDVNAKSGIQLEQVGLTATPPLDAAQRKTLPAWIREGLEKMEREKQRQADRDREMKERDEKRRQEKLIEQNLLMQLNANESSPKLPAKSKFESDSDSDNDDTVNSDYSENMPKARMAERTTVGSSSASASANATGSVSTTVPTFKPHRTKAEILTEIMLSVRKNLTEILLEVTNEEIYAIAQDTLSKVRTKGRKPQTVQKNALTAITPALGLVGYADSDASKSDDDSDSDDEKDADQRASDNDSESELMRTIHRRKAAFESKTIEIESYLADLEEKEKLWLDQDDNGQTEHLNSPNSQSPVPITSNQQKIATESNDSQRDTQKTLSVLKTERKGSRFSDAKALVYNVANSQLINPAPPTQIVRQNSLEHRPPMVEPKKSERDRREEHSDDSDSSRKRSKHTSMSSKSSHHRSKRDYSRSPSHRKHKKSSRKRSSSSSSDRSSYSRYSDRSRKHSRRDRSSSDDRTSRSSQGSHKRDKHSREKSYSRSHSYKKSRH